MSGEFTPTACFAARKYPGWSLVLTPFGTLSLIYNAATNADTLMSASSESGLLTMSRFNPMALASF